MLQTRKRCYARPAGRPLRLKRQRRLELDGYVSPRAPVYPICLQFVGLLAELIETVHAFNVGQWIERQRFHNRPKFRDGRWLHDHAYKLGYREVMHQLRMETRLIRAAIDWKNRRLQGGPYEFAAVRSARSGASEQRVHRICGPTNGVIWRIERWTNYPALFFPLDQRCSYIDALVGSAKPDWWGWRNVMKLGLYQGGTNYQE